jgi:hypothetical protein
MITCILLVMIVLIQTVLLRIKEPWTLGWSVTLTAMAFLLLFKEIVCST